MSVNKASRTTATGRRGFLIYLSCLVIILGFLFAKSFEPGYAHFSNDGPLGPQVAACNNVVQSLTGQWNDLFWVGMNGGGAPLNLNSALTFLLGPIGFAKFLAPVSLLILGLCAWVFFRQMQLSPALCVVAGLAAALNSNFFSNVCWGLGSRALALGVIFLALAALTHASGRWGWVRIPLAGLAVGMSIMDAADNGAIFSIYVGAYAFFVAFIEEGPSGAKVVKGLVRGAVVAVFAAFVATQVLISILGTQVVGMQGMEQDKESAEQRWDWATQWSLPKAEVLRVIIPGLYGYRMDTPDGGQYWGNVGQQPGYEQNHGGFPRYSGAGEYAGVLVILIGAWAVGLSFVAGSKTFTPRERKLIWFWTGAGAISLLLAFGRYAPFYHLLYKLPYFSTIRNPIKFMHPFHLSAMILFGYGLLGLSRRYLENFASKPRSMSEQVKAWWGAATGFEKKWGYAAMALIGLSFLGFMWFSANGKTMKDYISSPAFDANLAANPGAAAQTAAEISRHALHEIGFYLMFLIVSVGLVILIMSGVFSGKRARWAAVLLGIVLVVDLARANAPWIKYYNYEEKYASNPVVDILKDKPWEHRVSMPMFQLDRNFSLLQQVYHVEWLQHHFAYYNVQSLDIPQEPRMPADKAAYRQALATNMVRLWQLTNTRYVFGLGNGFVEQLNQQLDPAQKRFQAKTFFNLVQAANGNITAQTNAEGPFSLIEFTGALPRAKLYTEWQTVTNNEAMLQELAKPNFDPGKTVLVASLLPAPEGAASSPGTVDITSYAPKHVQLRSDSGAGTLLLVNDKYDPGWKATVDGKPTEVLKCNFFMQGLQLPPGKHIIELSFEPPVKGLYVSLAALIIGLVLCGLLIVTRGSNDRTDSREEQRGEKTQAVKS
jgi:hypothetical protein